MNLHSWASNSAKVRGNIPVHLRDDSEKISVLRTQWNQYSNQFSIKSFNPVSHPETITLRELLSSMSLFFDLCGIFAPLSTSAMLLFQEAQNAPSATLDSLFPEDVRDKWNKISADFTVAKNQKFSRFIANYNDADNVFALHVSADASARAYAAIAYVCVTNRVRKKSSGFLLCARKDVS